METQKTIHSDTTSRRTSRGTPHDSSSAEPAVVVRNLRKSYKNVPAVNDVSFEVRRGEVFGLLGPNGAGKTTTVEIIEGLRAPDGGDIRVCGFDPPAQPDEVKRRIGVALQSMALHKKIKVREALKLFAGFYPKQADIEDLIRLVMLEDKANAYFDTLSGGQQQRLKLALALVNDPELVIFDEPTVGLDPQARREIHALIEKLRRQGKTLILTTHYIEEAEKLCDRVAVIDNGKLIACGPPRELIRQACGPMRIEVHTTVPVPTAHLRRIPFVRSISETGGGFTLQTVDLTRTLAALMKWIEAEGYEVTTLNTCQPTLEDVFIELTGRRIRE